MTFLHKRMSFLSCSPVKFNYLLKEVRHISNLQSSERKKKKYSKSVLLPQSSLPGYIKPRQIVDHEQSILKGKEFSLLYQWQRKEDRTDEFVLHDGPPYANGKLHIGHAVNKILKDFIVRHKLIKGYKVHFIPGWDCHGLPIELKAVKDEVLKPLQIIERARKFASEAINVQCKMFKRFGILADWENPYHTFDSSFINKELQLFIDLYEAGYIIQANKPVFLSPSSQTVLAESEIEYHNLDCDAVFVAVPVVKLPTSLEGPLSKYNCTSLYLAVFTTTPWSLPANKAICYNSKNPVCLIVMQWKEKMIAMLWSSNLLIELDKLSIPYTKVSVINNALLDGLIYLSPFNHEECQVLPANHVTDKLGTGFVHTAPAHGHDDFNIALQHGLSLDCCIDQTGHYKMDVGFNLAGKNVLNEGNGIVLKLFDVEDEPSILLSHSCISHSYPHDWRTKQPVIICASKQWFINVDAIRDSAMTALKCVTIPKRYKETMEKALESRPYWCISRQRIWGVPIPVFYDVDTKKPFTSKEIVDHFSKLCEEHGSDCWWKLSEEQLLPQHIVTQYQQSGKPLPVKGTDILDIWFDSASTWHSVLDDKIADVYLEGIDQFNAWFLCSLLTSIAARKIAPYRTLIIHEMVTDGENKKMSKSIGNVIDPLQITDGADGILPYGTDVLRYWVLSNFSSLQISDKSLTNSKNDVLSIRKMLKFLLGLLNGFAECDDQFAIKDLEVLDRYMLHSLYLFHQQVMEHYDHFRFVKVVQTIQNFVAHTSVFYAGTIKDKMYCDARTSLRRRSTQLVVNQLFDYLIFSVAPILPILAEEASHHHPVRKDWNVFYNIIKDIPAEWHQPDLASHIDRCLDVQKIFNKLSKEFNKKTILLNVNIDASGKIAESLQLLQSENVSFHSELCGLLTVSRVTLTILPDSSDSCKVEIHEADPSIACLRCFKCIANSGDELCQRCLDVVNQFHS